MPRTELPIANGFYENSSLPISAQECVNWYPAPTQSGGLSKMSLKGTPGLVSLATSGTLNQTNRGAYVKEGLPYFVNGDTLFRLDRTLVESVETFNLVTLGTITGTGRVSMADNGTQLMILVPSGDGFIMNEAAGTPFQQITDPAFTANGAPQHVVYKDGFFVITTDTKKFIVSALNDGLAYDAVDSGTAEADPDTIVAPIVHENQLFIAGSETIEVFQNIGGAGFPFQRVEGFVMSKGVFAPFSIVEGGGTFMFIGGGVNESPSIYAFAGSDVEPISTDAIDDILAEFTTEQIQQAFAWSYSQNGARFVAFSFTNITLVFDTVSGLWHERKSRITDGGSTNDTRCRVNSLVSAYNKVLVGDSVDGRIGDMSLKFFDEYGENLIRVVATQPFSNEGLSILVPELELTMEAGVGDLVTKNPVIRMSRSKDGKTFSDEITRGIGQIGEHNRRSIWRKLGRAARFEIFRFKFSEKVKPVIIKLEANIVGGTR